MVRKYIAIVNSSDIRAGPFEVDEIDMAMDLGFKVSRIRNLFVEANSPSFFPECTRIAVNERVEGLGLSLSRIGWPWYV